MNTESIANEIVERLMDDTLDTTDQLGEILGVDPSTETQGWFV